MIPASALRRFGLAVSLAASLGLAAGPVHAEPASTEPAGTDLTIAFAGPPLVLYDPARDACQPIDDPDMNPRAFRDDKGAVVMFALHFVARPLRGRDLDHVRIDCHSSLDSPFDPDPSHFADRRYVAATWTRDGRDVGALVHEEYHADDHGRCTVSDSLGCWFNTILAFHSSDGGTRFAAGRPLVVAAAPFTQDVGQGRHRGFFEPSNMFGDGRYVYAFASTTGWAGQDAGSCLFRTTDPTRPDLWRAFDGSQFGVRYADPYRSKALPQPCAVIRPFTFAVNSVVRHRPSGRWIALLQASASGDFPVDGFYYASSRDLIHWGPAHLLLAGRTLYSGWCKADGPLINYPSILDPASASRNFDTVERTPELFFVAMQARNCATSGRLLLRRPLAITVAGRAAAVGDAARTRP